MSDNPMEKISKLREVVTELFAQFGLDLEAFIIIPDENPDGVHIAQAVLHLDPVKVFGVVDQHAVDQTFESMTKAFEADDKQEKKVVDIRNQLKDSLAQLRPSDGIGLDRDEEAS